MIKASYGLYYASPAQLEDEDSKTWISRGANLVISVSQVSAGTSLARQDNDDEYMLLLPPDLRAQVRTKEGSLEINGESLTIVPPGDSEIIFTDAGVITRVFSARATDLCQLASNADAYKEGTGLADPLEDWPMPLGGYRVRNYPLDRYSDPNIFGRIFRSRNLMINVFPIRGEPRDPKNLSPHSHANFEQISLALEGCFIHHLRTPWAADSTEWTPDAHVEVNSPSAVVIPPELVHTTQAVGDGANWLVDVFAPPRLDFSRQHGVVRNADEYPMP